MSYLALQEASRGPVNACANRHKRGSSIVTRCVRQLPAPTAVFGSGAAPFTPSWRALKTSSYVLLTRRLLPSHPRRTVTAPGGTLYTLEERKAFEISPPFDLDKDSCGKVPAVWSFCRCAQQSIVDLRMSFQTPPLLPSPATLFPLLPPLATLFPLLPSPATLFPLLPSLATYFPPLPPSSPTSLPCSFRSPLLVSRSDIRCGSIELTRLINFTDPLGEWNLTELELTRLITSLTLLENGTLNSS